MKNNNESPIIELLKDIQDYFIENDLECGQQGSEIYGRISDILYDLQSGNPG